MGQRATPFATGEWYHCYSRGVDKRTIFTTKDEYRRFQALLYAANSVAPIRISDIGKTSRGPTLELVFETVRESSLVHIGAYALMPNHYHLVLYELSDNGITNFMRKLNTGYTMYFNIKHKRTGALFGSKFKSKHIDSDEYLQRVIDYVHGNPISLARTPGDYASTLETYPYSSFLDYTNKAGVRPESHIVQKDFLLQTTRITTAPKKVIADQLDFSRSDLEN